MIALASPYTCRNLTTHPYSLILRKLRMIKILDTISWGLEKIGKALATIILAIVFLLVFFGVIFRFINFRFAMYEELSRWCLVGMTFIGASVALKHKQHVGVNMLMEHLPLGVSKVCIIIAYLVIMFLMVIATIYSFKAALAAKGTTGDIVPFSMMYVRLTLPLGMSMMFVHLLTGLVKVFSAKEIKPVLIGI